MERYYGTDGASIACKAGYDEIHWQYNDKNQIIRIEYLMNGVPVLNNKKIAALEREYDEKNLVAVERYYGIEGERVKSSDGYSRIDRIWADAKHASSEAWFDENDQPMALKDTYCRAEYEYDAAWNRIVERYFGADGNPIASKVGADETRKTYNEKNQVTRIEYLLGGKPALNSNGYAAAERKLNEDGNVIREAYYGPENEPILNTSGYQTVIRTWADKKHVASEAYYDTDGKPVLCKDGYCRFERTYTEKGELENEKRFDLEGNEITDQQE